MLRTTRFLILIKFFVLLLVLMDVRFRAEGTLLLQEKLTFIGWCLFRVRMSWLKNFLNFPAILIRKCLFWRNSIIYLIIFLIWRIIIKVLRCHRWSVTMISIEMFIVLKLSIIQLPLRLVVLMFQILYALLLTLLLGFLQVIFFRMLMIWICLVGKLILIKKLTLILYVLLLLIMKALRICNNFPYWYLLIGTITLIKLVLMILQLCVLNVSLLLCTKFLLIRTKNMTRRYWKHSTLGITLILCFKNSLII